MLVCCTLTSGTGWILQLFGVYGMRRSVDEVFDLVGHYTELICSYRRLETAFRFHLDPWQWYRYPVPQRRYLTISESCVTRQMRPKSVPKRQSLNTNTTLCKILERRRRNFKKELLFRLEKIIDAAENIIITFKWPAFLCGVCNSTANALWQV